MYDWEVWARPEQIEPQPAHEWLIWFIRPGRGWGKTRTGSETTRKKKDEGLAKHIALVAPTAADARDVMVGLDPDSSGLLQVCPPWDAPTYEPSKRRAIWEKSGVVATLYSAEEPDRLRGPQHDFAWGDEPAAWENAEATMDNLMFGLRRGLAQAIFTGTPEPVKVIKDLMQNATVVTRGSMYDNPTLSPAAIKRLRDRYEGTRLGRQEIHGELLEDNPDALWTEAMINDNRLTSDEFQHLVDPENPSAIKIKRVVIPVDPAVTKTKSSNETGIVPVCIDNQDPPHGYVLDDMTIAGRPEQWARQAVKAFYKYDADIIIGEVNNGGDLIESVISKVDSRPKYKSVRASKGKMLRAEPISAFYEKGRIHHVGRFPRLEAQMCDYNGSQLKGSSSSPDRLDSLVWGFTELLVSGKRGRFYSW